MSGLMENFQETHKQRLEAARVFSRRFDAFTAGIVDAIATSRSDSTFDGDCVLATSDESASHCTITARQGDVSVQIKCNVTTSVEGDPEVHCIDSTSCLLAFQFATDESVLDAQKTLLSHLANVLAWQKTFGQDQ